MSELCKTNPNTGLWPEARSTKLEIRNKQTRNSTIMQNKANRRALAGKPKHEIRNPKQADLTMHDLKKQSQFASAQIGVKSFMEGNYDNKSALGVEKNKPNSKPTAQRRDTICVFSAAWAGRGHLSQFALHEFLYHEVRFFQLDHEFQAVVLKANRHECDP